MMDYYDKAVVYLTERPEEIYDAWDMCWYHVAGGLFQRVKGPRYYDAGQRYLKCGCLTQIRQSPSLFEAETPELTAAIVADESIPMTPEGISVAHLPIFAEWQRKIDAELGRTPRVWIDP